MRRLLTPALLVFCVNASAAQLSPSRCAQPVLTKVQAAILEQLASGPAIAVGMWTSTARQTNADDLQWNQQIGGDPAVFGWFPGRSGIVLTEPGSYLIQTRVPVYGAPAQPYTPYANLSITDWHQPPAAVSQYALAGQHGYSELHHLLLYVKAADDHEPYEVMIGFGADPLGYTQGAVLVIEKLQ